MTDVIAENEVGKFVSLSLPGSEARAEIAAAHGGILNRLSLDAGAGPVELITGLDSEAELAANTANAYRSVLLFPFPNRLKDGRYHFAGEDYEFPLNEVAFNNQLHGFLCHLNPDQVSQPSSNRALLHYRYNGLHGYYPFPCRISLEYHLESATRLAIRFAVTNFGTQTCPVGIGWHPYFKLEKDGQSQSIDELALLLPEVELIEVDERLLPTGATHQYTVFDESRLIGATVLDNCFRLRNTGGLAQVQLTSAALGHGIQVWQQSGGRHGCDYIQVYTPPDRQCLAIEPMSCNVNAFQNKEGLVELRPGATLSTFFGVSLFRSH